MADGTEGRPEGQTTTAAAQRGLEHEEPLTPPWEPQEGPPQIIRDPETVPLLEQIQAGRVVKVRSTEVAQVDKEDVQHTFALQIEAPPETANKILALVQSGAPVFAVIGVRQYRLGAAPPEPAEGEPE